MYDNCGELRDWIAILIPKCSHDSQGNTIRSRELLCRIKAQARDAGGKEAYLAATVQNEKRMDFKIRWRDGLCEGMSIEYLGAVYEITDISHLGFQRRGWMLLHTRRMKGENETHGTI